MENNQEGKGGVSPVVKTIALTFAMGFIISVLLVLLKPGWVYLFSKKSSTAPNKVADVSLTDVAELANRVASVASLRYTGVSEAGLENVRYTLAGDFGTKALEHYGNATRDEFIQLDWEIESAYREHYEALYLTGLEGPSVDGDYGGDEYASNDPNWDLVGSGATDDGDGYTEGPTDDYSDVYVDDYTDSDEQGADIDMEGPVDTYDEPYGIVPEDILIIDWDAPDWDEPDWNAPDYGKDIPTYEEWLQSEEAKSLLMDGRIVEYGGHRGVWTRSLNTDDEGRAEVLIAGRMQKINVGYVDNIGLLQGDHAYDFEPIRYGVYENGVVLIVLKTKEFIALPSGEFGDSDNYISSSYTVTLKGVATKAEDGHWMFSPTGESFVYLTEALG